MTLFHNECRFRLICPYVTMSLGVIRRNRSECVGSAFVKSKVQHALAQYKKSRFSLSWARACCTSTSQKIPEYLTFSLFRFGYHPSLTLPDARYACPLGKQRAFATCRTRETPSLTGLRPAGWIVFKIISIATCFCPRQQAGIFLSSFCSTRCSCPAKYLLFFLIFW